MTSRNVPSSGGSLPWQNKPSKWHSNSIQLVWWSFLALYCSRASGLATTSLALSPFAAIHRLATKKVFPFNSICTMSTVSGLTIRSTEEVSAISKMSCLHHGMLQTVSTLVSNWCFRVKRISSSGGIKIDSTGDLFAISFPAGRPAVSRPSGRPLPCVPAGRPLPCSPAGRPNWLAGWLVDCFGLSMRPVSTVFTGRPAKLAGWLAGWLFWFVE